MVLEPLLRLMPELSLEVGRGFWTILSLVIFAPIFEELICRGVVLGSLRGKFGVTTAWLVSSLFFGVLHGQPVQVINATVIGLVLGYVYLATDSLWSVMILHALNNAVAYLALATGHGNSVPRFHVTWGTGPGVLEPFVHRVREGERRGLASLRFRHRVSELITSGGAVTGV